MSRTRRIPVEPCGGSYRVVRFPSNGTHVGAQITRPHSGATVATVYGPPTEIERRVERAIVRYAGTPPGELAWYELAVPQPPPEPDVLPARYGVANPSRASLSAHLRWLADRVDAEAPEHSEVDMRRDGDRFSSLVVVEW